MSWKEVKQSGQAVLLVLLVVAVALGFGLSIISQSTTELRISLQDQESARAFNAAEAGIEEALRNISGGGQIITVDGLNVEYDITGKDTLEGTFEENETAQVLITGAAGGLSQLTVEWVDSNSEIENPVNCGLATASSGQTPASLLISVISNSDEVTRYGVNACNHDSDNGMNFESSLGTDNYFRSYTFAVSSSDSYVRIRPIYNKASIRVVGNADLPTQLFMIDSTAQTPTEEAKAIRVTRTEPATPSVFDYVLFSGTNISK